MKRKATIFFVLGFLLFLASCVSSGGSSPEERVVEQNATPPAWVYDKHSLYPKASYLVEVGNGTNLAKAKENAVSALSQIFEVSVSSQYNIRSRYTNGEEMTYANEQIHLKSSQKLLNAKSGEVWVNPNGGEAYALVYIERVPTAIVYRNEISKNDQKITDLINRAETEESSLRKFAFYDSALAIATENEILLKQLDIIQSGGRNSVMVANSVSSVGVLHTSQADTMAFRIDVTGEGGGSITSALKETLTSFGFILSDEGSLSVVGDATISTPEEQGRYFYSYWGMDLTLYDENNKAEFTFRDGDRVAGMTPPQALDRVELELAKSIEKDFSKNLGQKLTKYAK